MNVWFTYDYTNYKIWLEYFYCLNNIVQKNLALDIAFTYFSKTHICKD